jgi:hypothetical protein
MANTLEQYREARQNWMKLRNQARKELIARFHQVSAELLQIQKELLEDFGEKVTIPVKPKKAAKPVKAAAPAPVEKPVEKPEVVALRKKLAAQQKKLAEAQAAGKPTKAIEDRIYEIEDDLRLALG